MLGSHAAIIQRFPSGAKAQSFESFSGTTPLPRLRGAGHPALRGAGPSTALGINRNACPTGKLGAVRTEPLSLVAQTFLSACRNQRPAADRDFPPEEANQPASPNSPSGKLQRCADRPTKKLPLRGRPLRRYPPSPCPSTSLPSLLLGTGRTSGLPPSPFRLRRTGWRAGPPCAQNKCLEKKQPQKPPIRLPAVAQDSFCSKKWHENIICPQKPHSPQKP